MESKDSYLPWGTRPPKCNTTTAHITNSSLGAGIICAIWRHHTRLALELVLYTHECMVGGHGLGHLLPERGVQGSIRWPAPANRVRVASGVLKGPHGTCLGRVEGLEGRDIGEVGVGVVDAEIARVDFVHTIAGVQVGQRCDRGAHPADVDGMIRVLHRAIVGVVDHCLIFVRVAEEDAGDNVWGEPGDDLIEEIWQSLASVSWLRKHYPRMWIFGGRSGNQIGKILEGLGVWVRQAYL